MQNLTNELQTINGGTGFPILGLQAAVDYLQSIEDAKEYLNSLNGTSDDYHG